MKRFLVTDISRWPKRVAHLAVILAVAASMQAAAASGGVGGRPANPDPDNPRTQSIFIYTLDAGKTKNDQLYLSNSGDTDEVVQLYAVDGTVSNTGAFTCRQKVEPRTGIGNAVKLSKNEVTVPANGNLFVDFTLTLPKTLDVGEHDGCIVIQKKEDQTQQTGSIQVHTRTAVRMIVLVPGDIHREITIKNFSAHSSFTKGERTYQGPQVSFDLQNTGNVSADVTVSVHLKDMFGHELRAPSSSGQEAFFGGQYPVIAGTTFTANYDTEFQPFFGGWYTAQADIVYNKQAGTFGVDTSGDVLRSESQVVTIFFWPSGWFFLVLGLLILSAMSFVAWRIMQTREASRRARRLLRTPVEKPLWGPYEVQQGDTLKELAHKSGVPLNKIAIMNKLDAPYTLKAGQKIYLPHKRNAK